MDIWQWLGTNAAQLSAAAAIVAAFAAVWTVRQAAGQTREATRPMVIALMEPPEHSVETVDLVIRNVGATPARGVQVAFDPPLPSVADDTWALDGLRTRYARRVSIVAPGQSMRNAWWVSSQTGNEENPYGLPAAFTVRISYRRSRWLRYSDEFSFHLPSVLMETISVDSHSILGSQRRQAKALEGIQRDMQRLARQSRTAPPNAPERPGASQALLVRLQRVWARITP